MGDAEEVAELKGVADERCTQAERAGGGDALHAMGVEEPSGVAIMMRCVGMEESADAVHGEV